MKVRDIMTADPVCCAKDETAESGALLMKELNTGAIPVVEDDKSYKLVGMLTDRDLAMSVVAQGKAPADVTVEQCLSGKLVAVSLDEDVEKAAELMAANHFRRLPVVDSELRIQGIIAAADITLYSNNVRIFEKAKKRLSRETAAADWKLYSLGASYFAPERQASYRAH